MIILHKLNTGGYMIIFLQKYVGCFKLPHMLTVTLLFICSLMFTNVQSQIIVNPNGSFELSNVTAGEDTSAVEGWSFNRSNPTYAKFRIVDDVVKDGNRALAVNVLATGSNPWDIEALSYPVPVVLGETYSYSVWVKSSASASTVHLTVGGPAPSYVEYLRYEQNGTIGTGWKLFTQEFTVPLNADLDTARVPFHFNFTANVGDTLYIDSLRIEQITGLPPDPSMFPVVVEAELADTLGNEWAVDSVQTGDYAGTKYISITTDMEETSGGSLYPGTNRTAVYQVTFPDTGMYDLFVHLYVGSGTFNDDSFFKSKFGSKDPNNPDDWYRVNGMASAGFNSPDAIVREAGGLGSEQWKWVCVSRNGFGDSTVYAFDVQGDLTKIFSLGARENGLWIDKFAFGKSNLYFSVENLDNGEPGSTTMPAPAWEGPPLASDQPKFVGNIYSSPQIENFESYWNQVTPENAGKWGSVEGTRDVMNWTGLDAAYKLAKDNGFPFHFHVLLWGAQQPSWINDLTAEEQLEEITEWFDSVAVRYPDIDYLEVVNESLPGHNPPDGLNGRANYKAALGGDGETGWDWVLNAFRMAREKFPVTTQLMINDYGIIGSLTSTNQYLGLIHLLQDENLIDIIGVQGHAFTTTAPTATMRSCLTSLSTTGLPIQVTELDIDGPSDEIQLQDYQRIFPALYEHPGVMGITLWGWRPGLWRNDQGAYIINSDGSERPALEWLRTYLDSVDVTVSVDDISNPLYTFQLSDNYPNPFNPSTAISYEIPKRSEVSIKIYDITGRLVTTLVDDVKNAGQHIVTFRANQLSSGVYFYRLQAGSYSAVKRMMLLK